MNCNSVNNSVVENQYVRFWLEDGILYSVNKIKFSIGLEEAEELVELRHEISNNVSRYWCFDVNNLMYVSKEAHIYFNENGQNLVEACAVVANSFLTRFMTEIFMTIKKTKIPMKIFSSQEKAVKWLLEIKSKSEIESYEYN